MSIIIGIFIILGVMTMTITSSTQCKANCKKENKQEEIYVSNGNAGGTGYYDKNGNEKYQMIIRKDKKK